MAASFFRQLKRLEMAQVKKGKGGTGKKSAQTGPGKGGKTAVSQNTGGSNKAFYILIIIILITVIVLLVNRYADRGFLKFSLPANKESEQDKKGSGQQEKSVTVEVKQEKDRTAEKDVKEGREQSAAEMDITIYLLKLDEKTEKIYLAQVKRKISAEKPLESALVSLIKGPTRDEENRGFITAVPGSLKVRGINIKGRTAEIDFSGTIEEGAAGDILLKRVQQIVYTATQFDNIESIVILINGKKRKTLGSDGFSISGPLRR